MSAATGMPDACLAQSPCRCQGPDYTMLSLSARQMCFRPGAERRRLQRAMLKVKSTNVCPRNADKMPSCVLLPSGLCLCKCTMPTLPGAMMLLTKKNNPSGKESENRKPKTRDRGREDGNPAKKGGRESRDRRKATGPPPEANHRGGKAKGGQRKQASNRGGPTSKRGSQAGAAWGEGPQPPPLAADAAGQPAPPGDGKST
jgi:hypothetical protein